MKIQKRKRDQRKREQKAARRKAVLAKKSRQTPSSLSLLYQARATASTFGVKYCMITEGIFDIGIGHVVLGRAKSLTRLATAVLLVDVHCLGVKDAFYTELDDDKFLEFVSGMSGTQSAFVDIDPACARKFVAGAVEYAKQLGFAPHDDYPPADALFGDINADSCSTNYVFGKDGKPFFLPGPHDTPAKIRKVMRTLTDRIGEGNFDFIVQVDGF